MFSFYLIYVQRISISCKMLPLFIFIHSFSFSHMLCHAKVKYGFILFLKLHENEVWTHSLPIPDFQNFWGNSGAYWIVSIHMLLHVDLSVKLCFQLE